MSIFASAHCDGQFFERCCVGGQSWKLIFPPFPSWPGFQQQRTVLGVQVQICYPVNRYLCRCIVFPKTTRLFPNIAFCLLECPRIKLWNLYRGDDYKVEMCNGTLFSYLKFSGWSFSPRKLGALCVLSWKEKWNHLLKYTPHQVVFLSPSIGKVRKKGEGLEFHAICSNGIICKNFKLLGACFMLYFSILLVFIDAESCYFPEMNE